MRIFRLLLFFAILVGIVYLSEILKQPGNTFAEKYNNLAKNANLILEKVKKGEL